jgi:hypothetical protein
MPSAGDDLSDLQALQRDLRRQLTTRLRDATAPLPELRELQERLKLLDAAIADPQRATQRRRRATVAAVVAVALILSLGWLVPMPSVPFTLDADAGAVRMQLVEAGELEAQAVAGELLVEGWATLASPDAALRQQAGNDSVARLSVSAASLVLRRVGYPATATLDVVAGAENAGLTIHSPQAPIDIALEVSGRTTTRFGANGRPREAEYSFSEWIRLRAGDAAASAASASSGQTPSTVRLRLGREAQTQYTWTRLRPAEVRFVERGLGPDNEPTIASSLQKARIQLQASGSEVLLGAGDELDLAGLDLQRCELVLDGSVHVRLTGTARTMLTRTGHFERSLKPSVLEYAARHKTVELLWSAALLLWGVARWLQGAARAED